MIDAFAERTLETRDPALLERLYREAFGFEVLSGPTPRGGDEGGLHMHFALSASPGTLDDLVRRLSEHASVNGPLEHPGGDRSIYVEDPEGNVVEVWDFFRHGDGAREGVGALR